MFIIAVSLSGLVTRCRPGFGLWYPLPLTLQQCDLGWFLESITLSHMQKWCKGISHIALLVTISSGFLPITNLYVICYPVRIRLWYTTEAISKVTNTVFLITPSFIWDYLFKSFSSLPASQWLTPLSFMWRIARVPLVGSSSREETSPRIGSFNFWNKPKSGGLMSELEGAWDNTTHP